MAGTDYSAQRTGKEWARRIEPKFAVELGWQSQQGMRRKAASAFLQ
jgi:hypothetical protein